MLNSKDFGNDARDYTCNGHCSNCGNCCIPWLPITISEYQTIKQFIKDNNIKAINPIQDDGIHIDCPFHDFKNHKCNIYSVRPEVCRNFICSNSFKKVDKDRRYYDKRADLNGVHLNRFVPFDLLFFDSPLLSLFIAQDILNNKGKVVSQKELVTLLKNMGSGLRGIPIPNTFEIAEAIEKGNIKLEFEGGE